MEIVELSERSSDVITKLIALWKASVVATHTFLSAKEIDDIKPEVGSGLRAVETLIAVLGKDGKFLAFMVELFKNAIRKKKRVCRTSLPYVVG